MLRRSPPPLRRRGVECSCYPTLRMHACIVLFPIATVSIVCLLLRAAACILQDYGTLGYTVEDGDQHYPRLVEGLLGERVLSVRGHWTGSLRNYSRWTHPVTTPHSTCVAARGLCCL